LPSLGGRSRPAACEGIGEEPLPPLREPASDGTAACPSVARFSLEPGRSRLSVAERVMDGEVAMHVAARAKALAPVAVRPFTPDDAAQWDQLVETRPEATFCHRIGWRRILLDV